MKRIFLYHFSKSILFFQTFLFFGVYLASAQIQKPITWTYKAEVGSDSIKLFFEANIDEKWYLYSSDFDPELGPLVTTFNFLPNEHFQRAGDILPIGSKKSYDSIFEGEYTYFKNRALFIQKGLVKKPAGKIAGSIEYQVCSEITGQCIPLEEDFEFVISTSASPVDQSEAQTVKGDLLEQRDSRDPYTLGSFLLVAFLAGLAALFTPCVFPMIPMTVTFFTGKDHKKSGRIKNGLFYGVFIILIYGAIGALVAPFMGPEVANELATGWFPNLLFFTIFLLFSLSFFGLFEITLPHKWVNSADRLGDKGGLLGVFFMALTLVLVSFSCTGPIVGSLLVESAGGLRVKPILGMIAFSAAFAIPFSLFALFPGWLSRLPKSGGWLNRVKVILGFLELALAFKFLSIADQAYHWGILDREVFLAIWMVIFSLLGLYLLGKIKFKDDEHTNQTTTVGGLLGAMVVFSFVVYMVPGLFGAPLKGLSGYLPPLHSQDFILGQSPSLPTSTSNTCEEPLYKDFLSFPHGLQGYFDYQQALNCAKETGKPIFIDFTGHGCVNCREMEARVWSDPSVLKILNESYILLALYVDDKTTLPESKWYTSSYDGKTKKTIGRQNADFQITKFQNNAQPYYVLINKNEELLMQPKAYDLSIPSFIQFLRSGIQKNSNNK